jgi:hypothetical protein
MGFSWIEAAIVAAIVLILGAVGVAAWSDSQKPTTEIRKDEWDCVRTEPRSHLQPMQVGKVMILMPMTSTVCVEYRRH